MKKLAKRLKKLAAAAEALGADFTINIHPDGERDKFIGELGVELGETPVVESSEGTTWAYFLNRKVAVFY